MTADDWYIIGIVLMSLAGALSAVWCYAVWRIRDVLIAELAKAAADYVQRHKPPAGATSRRTTARPVRSTGMMGRSPKYGRSRRALRKKYPRGSSVARRAIDDIARGDESTIYVVLRTKAERLSAARHAFAYAADGGSPALASEVYYWHLLSDRCVMLKDECGQGIGRVEFVCAYEAPPSPPTGAWNYDVRLTPGTASTYVEESCAANQREWKRLASAPRAREHSFRYKHWTKCVPEVKVLEGDEALLGWAAGLLTAEGPRAKADREAWLKAYNMRERK